MNKTISLCMIVKNEEKVLSRCLDSVKDKVDEIIIVDTGSTDSTLEISKKYTSKVYHYEWQNDFSAARNESLKHATSDFILVLDADEYLEQDADLLSDLERNGDFYLLQINNEMSLKRSFTHFAVRLFRNDDRIRYRNRLHEHLDLPETVFKGEEAKTVIQHSGYIEETMAEKDKLNRNLSLMIKEVEEHPTAYNLFNMGKTYLSINRHDKAIEYFKKAYSLSHGKVFMPELLTKFAYSLGELNRQEEGLLILKDAVVLFPQETEMKYIQGRLYVKAGYIKDAIKCFQTCLELGDQGTTVTEGSGGYMARFQLAELYEQEGMVDEGYREILKVLQLKRNFIPALNVFLEMSLRLNIPMEDLDGTLIKVYRLESVEDLQLLLNTLYSLRHPILDYYLTKYNINAQLNVIATAKLYCKKYDESRTIWNSIENKNEENAPDILLLAIILKDVKLLESIKLLLNVNHKEFQALKNFILNNTPQNIKISSHLINGLFEIARRLITLREFDVFESLGQFFFLRDEMLSYKISTLLSEYGFDEIALDILAKVYAQYPNHVDVIRLLGDLCYKNNYFEDAQLLYTKLSCQNKDYSSYERNYKLLKKLGNNADAHQLKIEMSSLFPLSMWLNERIS
ncbi:glycosyltransferase [Paenibacillus cellulositrophicus]|uniref:glycosyltransferase n=1 Tax=Paenibacillus cellulositrophicus TaxID=562959 RepID=UPI003F7EB979